MTHLKKILPLMVSGLMYLTAASTAQAASFNNVVVFGDSLSDSGNFSKNYLIPSFKFTTNFGNTTVENVAAALGHPISASEMGGTNYAWGSAGVENNFDPKHEYLKVKTLPNQLDSYLSKTNGQADSHTLYQVWGGANDIFGLVSKTQDPVILMSGVTTAATSELGLLANLKAAGANYVVVYNLPNMGLTPQAHQAEKTVPGSIKAATQLSGLYNTTLNSGLDSLSASGLNIIPVNVYGLLNEVISNPTAYGFSNVTDEACGKASQSVACGPVGSGALYTYAAGTNDSYLFADRVHPTTAGHRLLAQAVLAELAAPSQMSLLSEVPLSITKAQYRAIKNEMLNDADGKDTRVFLNLDYNHQKLTASSDSPALSNNNVNLTFGSDAKVNDQVSAGVGMSLNQQDGHIAGNLGQYSLFDVSALGYALYHQDNIYLGGFANAGSLHFNNIKRRIQLGNAERIETADAQGYHMGAGLDGGYWFNIQDLKTGPFVHAEWQTIKLNKFAEKGADSTSMWFDDQQRDSFVTSLGWRLKGDWAYNNVIFSPFAELAWNHDFQTNPLSVRAGLNTMGGSFVMTGYTPEKDWGTVSLGLSTQYSKDMTAWVSANSDFSHASADNLGLNVGMKYSF
ncbi:autotransporter domain-containing protein [Acinetobacter sp. MD2]|uniref:autotransporter domain-containing protein n=1 Tax=Acinetobacter sp. MD2 TaxID=2600066 RepID=UPI002D1F11FF|nr:autotransporter domain-containing protein [Acinetobacter sp. MD2]MEB3766454.1 autotransporter domain-containing protein [Acinetobacter sp. MD2]